MTWSPAWAWLILAAATLSPGTRKPRRPGEETAGLPDRFKAAVTSS